MGSKLYGKPRQLIDLGVRLSARGKKQKQIKKKKHRKKYIEKKVK